MPAAPILHAGRPMEDTSCSSRTAPAPIRFFPCWPMAPMLSNSRSAATTPSPIGVGSRNLISNSVKLRAAKHAHRIWRNEVNHPMKRWLALLLVLSAILMVSACKKKAAPPPPPPPPAPPAPTASLSANPDSVQKGQSTPLTWQTTNATDVSIDGIGPVETNGSKAVTPDDSTTYRLTAKGSGGTQDATARVTDNAPTAAAPPAPSLTEQQL